MKRMLMRKPFSKMEGLTLLETMFAIAIGALVLIGAVIFYMSTKQSANASKTVGDMNGIVAGFQSFIAGGNALTANTTLKTIQDAGFLPSPLNDAWGQEYTVDTQKTPGSVIIGIPGIGAAPDDKNCQAITTMVGSSATVGGASSESCSFTYPL